MTFYCILAISSFRFSPSYSIESEKNRHHVTGSSVNNPPTRLKMIIMCDSTLKGPTDFKTLIQRFYYLQSERLETYRLFEE